MTEKERTTGYAAGELVRIRESDEIRRTLDEDSKLDGCLMTEQMYGFCGNTVKILRVVRNIFDEYEFRMFETRRAIYILEDLNCDGRVHEFDKRCDRSCCLLWHEVWLKEALREGAGHER